MSESQPLSRAEHEALHACRPFLRAGERIFRHDSFEAGRESSASPDKQCYTVSARPKDNPLEYAPVLRASNAADLLRLLRERAYPARTVSWVFEDGKWLL